MRTLNTKSRIRSSAGQGKTRSFPGLLFPLVLSALLLLGSCAGLPESETATGGSDVGAMESSPSAAGIRTPYPGEEDGSLFFWELSREGKKIYVLGSIHLASPDIYPLPEKVMSGFEKSSDLMVEVNLLEVDMNEAQDFIATRSALPPGKVLGDFISPDDELLLIEILDRYGIPYRTVETLQPWVISNTLAMLSSFEVRMDPEYGIDLFFTRQAAMTGRDIHELESLQGQLEILSGTSLEAQVYDLSRTLEQFSELGEYMEGVLTLWHTGDLGGMEDLLLGEMPEEGPADEYYDSLFRNRNGDWAAQIEEFISGEDMGPEALFIVVGSGHLVGPDNFIELLIDEGYSARRY